MCTRQVGADPFTEEKAAKRERVKKNQERHVANLAAAGGGGTTRGAKGAPRGGKGGPRGGGGVPSSVQLSAKLPEHGRGRPTKRSEMGNAVSAAQRLARPAVQPQRQPSANSDLKLRALLHSAQC